MPNDNANSPTLRHLILGTAGHIDHGKTSLVRALTGTDTDRLPEEKRRGMTIELGFAELPLGDVHFGVVDVPGHEKFIRTMVCGATGIDLALLVVAADDSVMPQTVEHVEVLGLLGVRAAVVAITKIDAVPPDMVELVAAEVEELLAGTPLAGAAVCPISSVTGAGLDALRAALAEAAGRVGAGRDASPFRMAIDRVFTVQGRGTVVTGSVLRGVVHAGDALELWPGGVACKVREIESHGQRRDAVTRGQRAALNLIGVDRAQVERGGELATPGYLLESRLLDVSLRVLPTHVRPIRSGAVVQLGIGTAEAPVRVALLDRPALGPGEAGYAQLRCGLPLTAVFGQRFILRDPGTGRTLGGGTVLRPVTKRRHRHAAGEVEALQRLETGDQLTRLEEVLRASGFDQPPELQLCARAGVERDALPRLLDALIEQHRWGTVEGTDVHATPAAAEDAARRLESWLERFHQRHADQPGRNADAVLGWLERAAARALARPLLERFIREGRLKRLGPFVCLPKFAPQLSAADERHLASMIEEFRSAGFQPPALAGLSFAAKVDRKRLDKLVTLAAALGELVPIGDGIYLHAEHERALRQAVAEEVARTGGATVAEIRERLRSSRKYVVPFVEYLDRVGFTKRVGDRRVLAVEAAAGSS